ncbi:hypothetical protein ABBQ32_012772 [Trebouxia sp. C0010 RCD-2024]
MQHASTPCRQPATTRYGNQHLAPARPIYCMRHGPMQRPVAHAPRNQGFTLGQGLQVSSSSASAKQDQSRVFAASPALDSSGGDLPPISDNSKATAEGDDDNENSSSHDIDSLLAKAGSSSAELPADMQAAMARGALFTSDIRLWLQLMSTPIVGSLCKLLPAFRSRMLGNPRFLMVLGIEEAIGVAAKWSAEKSSRKDNFWKEFDFVLSDMALEVIGDFAVVWLLSPTRSFSPAAKNSMARYINGLPGHALQVGKYSPVQRAATVLYRGAQFFAVSFAASLVGHSLTKYLVDRARAKNPHPKAEGGPPDKELAPVLDNSIAWGGFVATSTNVRYQTVNAFEERALDAFVKNGALKSVLIFLIRFGNTFWGGAQWVQYAKLIGIQ